MSAPTIFEIVPVANLTRRTERFACTQLRGVLTAGTCVDRQTARVSISYGRGGGPLHETCARCHVGAQIARQVAGDTSPIAPPARVVPVVTHAAPPPAGTCARPGCRDEVPPPHPLSKPQYAGLCRRHRTSAQAMATAKRARERAAGGAR
jgi:hypothetical protein